MRILARVHGISIQDTCELDLWLNGTVLLHLQLAYVAVQFPTASHGLFSHGISTKKALASFLHQRLPFRIPEGKRRS